MIAITARVPMPEFSNHHSTTPPKSLAPVDPDKKAKKPWQAYLSGSPTLLISILLHIILAVLAAYFIVQRIETRRKQNFTEVNVKSSSSAAAQAQHQVEMIKKKNAMTTPDIIQRVTTTNLSAITLPEISLPSDSSAASASKMGAAEVSGLGNGMGTGTGAGTVMTSPTVQIDTAAIAASAFGLTNGKGLGLEGYFYDLKQTSNGLPTETTVANYPNIIADFMNTGWKDNYFIKYFKAPKPMYLPQLYIPYMLAAEGPAAFGVEKLVKPKLWVVLYKGKIKVDHTAQYRFVGYADDVCEVAIDKQTVLDGSYRSTSTTHIPIPDVVKHPATDFYKYEFATTIPEIPHVIFKFPCGDWVTLEEGKIYEMDVLIGEHPGGTFGCWLFVERKGSSYDTSSKGSPILPLFRVSNVKMPSIEANCPAYDRRDIGWTTVDDGADASDSLNPTAQPAAPAN